MFFGFGILSNLAFLFIIWLIFKRLTKNKGDGKGGFEMDFNGLSEVYFALCLAALGAITYSIIRLSGNLIDQQIVLLIIFFAASVIAYSLKRIVSLAISLVALPSWWAIQGSSWAAKNDSSTSAVLFVILSYLAVIFLVGKVQQGISRYPDFSKVYMALGFLPATIILFVLSTNSGVSMLREFSQAKNVFGSLEVTIVTIISILISLGLLLFTYTKKYITELEAGSIFAYLCIFLAVMFFPPKSVGYNTYGYSASTLLSPEQLIWAAVFNLAIFAEVLILIFLGYNQRKPHLINLGSGILFLLIIVKYFDWFFSFIDKSVFFIGAGTLLLALGYFMEKGRRYMLSKITVVTPEEKPNE